MWLIVSWAVCVSVCRTHRWALQKRLNWLRCRLGYGVGTCEVLNHICGSRSGKPLREALLMGTYWCWNMPVGRCTVLTRAQCTAMWLACHHYCCCCWWHMDQAVHIASVTVHWNKPQDGPITCGSEPLNRNIRLSYTEVKASRQEQRCSLMYRKRTRAKQTEIIGLNLFTLCYLFSRCCGS